MKTKKEELNNLFRQWANTDNKTIADNDFIADGIIDEEKWRILEEKNKKKVLFLLKEPGGLLTRYIDDDIRKRGLTSKNDLCEFFRFLERPGGSFCALGERAYGLQNISAVGYPSYEEAKSNRNEAFLSSAIMNIKKVAGYQQCNVGRLYNYARRKQINYYILEEFKIINPDIILFDGKLFDFLKTLIPLEEINSCKNIYHTASFEHPLFIKTCHPQAGKWKEGGKVIAAGWKAIYEAILEPYMVYLQKSC